MSTVVPMLGYTAATQNLYQPIEGVQLFTGPQAQPTTFPTTYQGVSDEFVWFVYMRFERWEFVTCLYYLYLVGRKHLCSATVNDLRISNRGNSRFISSRSLHR